MRSMGSWLTLAVSVVGFGDSVWAQPVFINGLTIEGGAADKTGTGGANNGRLGFFSDIYYDRERDEWWALSDRGPGGGVLDYRTRVQRFDLKVDRRTGAISHFRVVETVLFRDLEGQLFEPSNPNVGKPSALNGLNPLQLKRRPGRTGP